MHDWMQLMLKKAFTLVELLVVISVVSLMMAILMPTLGRARQQGRSVVCLSNLRQMGVAAQSYVNDNDGYYPPAYVNDPDPYDDIAINACWDFTHTKNWSSLKESTEAGLLWQAEMIDKIQQCPAFKGSANSSDPYTGYNYNTSYIGHGEGETIETPAKMSQVGRPSECALFGDGQWSGGANKFMRAPKKWAGDTDNSLKAAGTQGYRHNGRTNVVWCDGHASSQKEYYTETATSERKKIEKYNETAKNKIGFLSPDNSAYDLK
jgi:prepilin-type processing-associated H-X9-DG protein/prepilin-type N-terminal cleavage/methylation domain-containing protein